MIAVAATSPLSHLVLIGEIELLPALFAEVVIPPAVAAEVADPRAPEPLRTGWQDPRSWIRIADLVRRELPPEEVQRLHRGEREAILLARGIRANVVLIDECHHQPPPPGPEVHAVHLGPTATVPCTT